MILSWFCVSPISLTALSQSPSWAPLSPSLHYVKLTFAFLLFLLDEVIRAHSLYYDMDSRPLRSYSQAHFSVLNIRSLCPQCI